MSEQKYMTPQQGFKQMIDSITFPTSKLQAVIETSDGLKVVQADSVDSTEWLTCKNGEGACAFDATWVVEVGDIDTPMCLTCKEEREERIAERREAQENSGQDERTAGAYRHSEIAAINGGQ